MTNGAMEEEKAVIDREGLQCLLDFLARDGFETIGPTIRDDAIVYGPLAGVSGLPEGWTDAQEAGRYRLEPRGDKALFGFAAGPQSWKHFLYPPREILWTARRDGDGISIEAPGHSAPKYAFIGVRSCELHAIAIQDTVFCKGPHPDSAYSARRKDAFIVAVNCGTAGGTCFCVSMETGPKVKRGFDLALTELLDGNRHEFLIEAGSEKGAACLANLPHRPATRNDLEAAAAVIERTANAMGRRLETGGLKELLQENQNHPRWDAVADRCLACGNCTMVCPTCFCSTVEERADLEGREAGHVRLWDSCFTLDFSYLHGGSVRESTKARYRQWMTHKLAHWIDQFGTSGCVGCGRCITWCPTGIDITEEAAAIRAAQPGGGEKS